MAWQAGGNGWQAGGRHLNGKVCISFALVFELHDVAGNLRFGVQVVLQEKWKQRAVDRSQSHGESSKGSSYETSQDDRSGDGVGVGARGCSRSWLGHQQGVQSILSAAAGR